jgi:hypothetical protein
MGRASRSECTAQPAGPGRLAEPVVEPPGVFRATTEQDVHPVMMNVAP